jgi:hypothetical protein
MPKRNFLASRKRFQTWFKIINATFPPMRFDGRVKVRGEQLESVPACVGGGAGV